MRREHEKACEAGWADWAGGGEKGRGGEVRGEAEGVGGDDGGVGKTADHAVDGIIAAMF